MKHKTIQDLCKQFSLTEQEIQMFMDRGDLAFTKLQGGEIVFRQRHIKCFLTAYKRYTCSKNSHDVKPAKKGGKTLDMREIAHMVTVPTESTKAIRKEEVGIPVKLKLTEHGRQFKGKIDKSEDVIYCDNCFKEGKPIFATWILGKKGQWRLCDKCVTLPKFKRFKIRKRIE